MLAGPLPDCILLYFFLILLALSCVGVFAKANLTLFFLALIFLLFLGPIVLVFVTLMFSGKFFLLILSYLATKDVLSGNLTRFGTARRPRSNYCLNVAFILHLPPKGIPFSERNSSASLFSISSFFTPNIGNTFSYRLFSPHPNKSLSVWLIGYVLCLRVRLSLHKIYKYSPKEYAQTCSLNFLVAASFKRMCRFIFELFPSNFSVSLTYPELALRSRYILSSLLT